MLCKDTQGSATICACSLSAKHTFANTQRLQQPINEKFVFQQLTIMMYLCARLLVVCNVGVGPKDVTKVIEVCHRPDQRTPSQARENSSCSERRVSLRVVLGKQASPNGRIGGAATGSLPPRDPGEGYWPPLRTVMQYERQEAFFSNHATPPSCH